MKKNNVQLNSLKTKNSLLAKKKKLGKDNGVWTLVLSVAIMITLIALKNKGYFG